MLRGKECGVTLGSVITQTEKRRTGSKYILTKHTGAGVRRHTVGLERRDFFFFLRFLWAFKHFMRRVLSFFGGRVLLWSDI